MTSAVVVEGLRVVRGGVPVLDGLSLEVQAGAVTGLVGPSGGGKSTLMRAIVGVQRVAGGRDRGARRAGGLAVAPAAGRVPDAGAVGLRRSLGAREPPRTSRGSTASTRRGSTS